MGSIPRDWDEMRDPGRVQFEMPGWIACAPFEALCGLEILEAGAGRAVLRMPFRVKLSQGGGLLHGGAITTLADTAVAMAIKSRVPPGSRFATVELRTRFHAPVRRGRVEARARIVRWEGRDVEAEARVFDEEGRLVATFESRFRMARDLGPRSPDAGPRAGRPAQTDDERDGPG